MPFFPGLVANRWKGAPKAHGRTYPPLHIIHMSIGEWFEKLVFGGRKSLYPTAVARSGALVRDQNFTPNSTWAVGDSIKSDIDPGLEAGTNCILYLYTHGVYQWVQEYGVQPIGPFYLANSLPQIRAILECPRRFKLVTEI